MSTTYSKPHILVITRIPADEEYDAETHYEVIHPDDCPTETWIDDGAFGGTEGKEYTYHTCGVAYEVDNVGLESLSWDERLVPRWVKPETPYDGKDWQGLPEGRYVMRSWFTYYSYYGEYDGGLELLGLEGEVDVAT